MPPPATRLSAARTKKKRRSTTNGNGDQPAYDGPMMMLHDPYELGERPDDCRARQPRARRSSAFVFSALPLVRGALRLLGCVETQIDTQKYGVVLLPHSNFRSRVHSELLRCLRGVVGLRLHPLLDAQFRVRRALAQYCSVVTIHTCRSSRTAATVTAARRTRSHRVTSRSRRPSCERAPRRASSARARDSAAASTSRAAARTSLSRAVPQEPLRPDRGGLPALLPKLSDSGSFDSILRSPL